MVGGGEDKGIKKGDMEGGGGGVVQKWGCPRDSSTGRAGNILSEATGFCALSVRLGYIAVSAEQG